MSVWLVRAGAHGEYEEKFLREGRVYVTWDGLDVDLSKVRERPDLIAELAKVNPESKARTISNWAGQIWPFVHDMKAGDLIVMPLKTERSVRIGEIAGGYHHESGGPDPYFHWRSVKWIGESIPRTHFGKDLLFSFGAALTICRIQRNNAEVRLAAMRANGWKPESNVDASRVASPIAGASDEASSDTDISELAQDQIAQLIGARFKGHGLARLVDGILKAQGYTTYISPEGPDGGVDILAGSGALGFASPRLCVEVKSVATPIDRPTVDKLLGAVSKFHADEGLFVSWSGYKGNVQKELAGSFFRVRLWSQKELLESLFANYDRLDDEIKAELPLKRIWTVAVDGGG